MPTLQFDPRLLTKHFVKHKTNVNAADAAHYEKMAASFLGRPLPVPEVKCGACVDCNCQACGQRQQLHECLNDGDIIRFNVQTNEYGVVGANGFIRTYYKPTPELTGNISSISYFHNRCRPQ